MKKISKKVLFISLLLSPTVPFAMEELTRDLFEAIKKGDVAKVKQDIKLGADVNGRDNDGDTPLIDAARFDYPEITTLLLERDADINKANGGRTALAHAAFNDHLGVLRRLLEKYADCNTQDEEGWSPSMLAIRCGSPEGFRLLLKSGADINVKNKEGKTVSQLADAKPEMEKIIEDFDTQMRKEYPKVLIGRVVQEHC